MNMYNISSFTVMSFETEKYPYNVIFNVSSWSTYLKHSQIGQIVTGGHCPNPVLRALHVGKLVVTCRCPVLCVLRGNDPDK